MEAKKVSNESTVKTVDVNQVHNVGPVSDKGEYTGPKVITEPNVGPLVQPQQVRPNVKEVPVEPAPVVAPLAPASGLTFDQIEAVKRGNPLPVLLENNHEYYAAQLILDLAARLRADLPTPELTLSQRLEMKKGQKVLLDMPLNEMFGKIHTNEDIPELRDAVKVVYGLYNIKNVQ